MPGFQYINKKRLEEFKNLGERRMVHLKRKPCGAIKIIEFLPDGSLGQQFTFQSMDEVNLPEEVNEFLINYETEVEVEDLGDNFFRIKE